MADKLHSSTNLGENTLPKSYATLILSTLLLAAPLAADECGVNGCEVTAQYVNTLDMTSNQISNIFTRLGALSPNPGQPANNSDETEDHSTEAVNASSTNSLPGIYITTNITDNTKDTTSGERGYDNNGTNSNIGIDYRFGEQWIAGITYGYGDSDIDYKGNSDTFRNKIQNYIVYSTWSRNNFHLNTLLGYASGDITTKRESTDNDTVKGQTNSYQTYFSVSGRYDFVKGPWTYGPQSGYTYVGGTISSYDESNSSNAGIEFESQNLKLNVLSMGGRASYTWQHDWGNILPYCTLDLKRNYSNGRNSITVTSLQNGTTYNIEPDNLQYLWWQISAGLLANFKNDLTAYFNYETTINYDDYDANSFTLGVIWTGLF